MRRELRDMWTAALRSGNYKQGHGQLRERPIGGSAVDDKFCCLGVLLDLDVMTADERWYEDDVNGGSVPMCWDEDYGDSYDAQYEEAELPSFVKSRVGLTDDECSTLMELNDGGPDSQPQSFNQIADWIEENIICP